MKNNMIYAAVSLTVLLYVSSSSAVTVQAKMDFTTTYAPQQTRIIDELSGFALAKTDSGFSRFGGILSKRGTQTNFFHAQKINGRWFLVDPDGYLFLSVGLAGVSSGGGPTASAAYNSIYRTKAVWADSVTKLMIRNGYNTVGAWSDHASMNVNPKRLPYTKILNFMSGYGKVRGGTFSQPGHTGYPNDLIFVFDSAFVTFCDNYAKNLALNKTDQYLIGYFTDNELPTPLNALDGYLKLSTADQGYKAARAWLTARKGASAGLSSITTEDRNEFLRFFADKYYGIVRRAIKKYDPNHMVLGSRLNFHGLPIHFYWGAGPHVDALSLNIYGMWTPGYNLLAKISEGADKPIMVTEWYAKGMDSGLPNKSGAGWIVPTQRDRGYFYQNFTLNLLQSKFCVGWQWFKYMDNDTADANAEASNTDANKGIVTTTFKTYPALLTEMQEINKRVFRLSEYFDASTGTINPATTLPRQGSSFSISGGSIVVNGSIDRQISVISANGRTVLTSRNTGRHSLTPQAGGIYFVKGVGEKGPGIQPVFID